LGAAPMLSQYL